MINAHGGLGALQIIHASHYLQGVNYTMDVFRNDQIDINNLTYIVSKK